MPSQRNTSLRGGTTTASMPPSNPATASQRNTSFRGGTTACTQKNPSPSSALRAMTSIVSSWIVATPACAFVLCPKPYLRCLQALPKFTILAQHGCWFLPIKPAHNRTVVTAFSHSNDWIRSPVLDHGGLTRVPLRTHLHCYPGRCIWKKVDRCDGRARETGSVVGHQPDWYVRPG
jgi:hypothetical protein